MRRRKVACTWATAVASDGTGRVEDHTARHFFKHPIDHADVEVHMLIESGAEAVEESHRADVQGSLVHICRAGAVGLQSLRDDPQEDAQHPVERRALRVARVVELGFGG